MSIRLCLGECAKKGYEPEHRGVIVYSVEELCFFLKENACLLEEGLMSEGLADWLEKECCLPQLADGLRKALRGKVSLKAFVAVILDYTGFFSHSERDSILLTITENSQMNVYEKRKAKADTLLEKGQFGLADREYTRLLGQLPKEEESLRGKIYHGCGVSLARRFYFSQAGEYFWKAYEITGQLDSLRQYLLTKRLSMSEPEYMEFLKEHEELYEDSLLLEERLEELKENWQDSQGAGVLEGIRREKESDTLGYRQKLRERVEYLKAAYREMEVKG